MEYRLYKGTGFGSNENYKLSTDAVDSYLQAMPADSYITITDNKPFNSGAFRTGQAEILIKQSDILGIDSFLNLACFDYLRVLLPALSTNPYTNAYFYYFIDNIDLIAVKGGELGEYILKLTIRLDYFNTYKLDKLLLNMDVEESQFLIALSTTDKRNSFYHSPLPPYNNITMGSFMTPETQYESKFNFLVLLQTNLIGPVMVAVKVKENQDTATGQEILTDAYIYERILELGQVSKLHIDGVQGILNVTSIKMWLRPAGLFTVIGQGGTLTVYNKSIGCVIIEDTYSALSPINGNIYKDSTFNNSVILDNPMHYGYGTRTKYLLPPNEIYFGSSGWRASVQYILSPTNFEVIVNAFGKNIDVSADFEISVSKSAETDFWNIEAIGTGIKLIASAGQLAAGAATGNVISAGIGAVNLAGNVATLISGSPAQAVNIGTSGAFAALKVCRNIVGVINLQNSSRTAKELAQYGIKLSTPYHMETNCALARLHVLYPKLKGNSDKVVWYIKAKAVTVAQYDKDTPTTWQLKSVPTEAIRYLKELLNNGLHYFRNTSSFIKKSIES